jgi:hypothetical protein
MYAPALDVVGLVLLSAIVGLLFEKEDYHKLCGLQLQPIQIVQLLQNPHIAHDA